MISWPVRFEDVEGLFSNAFDPRREGKFQQMCHPEDGFGVAVAVGGIDVAFDDIIAHEPVNYERAFPIGGTDHKGMPKDVSFITECVGTDALFLTKIL